jgi:hypothetical protein
MFFRVQYTLRGTFLLESETLEFLEDLPFPTKLTLHRPTKEEDHNLNGGDCLGVVQTEEAVTEKVRLQFEASDPPRPAVVDILSRIRIRLHEFLVRAVCVLRWRRGSTGHPNPVVGDNFLQWSDDGNIWEVMPNNFQFSLDCGIPYHQLTDDIRTSTIELVLAGAKEPVGHELFQEAWSQRTTITRSSLLIGMTAAEVGVKSFIGDLIPEAEWLALHAPTPPLIQILTEYLPLIPVRQHIEGTAPFVPKGVLDSLRKGVTLRNKTAHAGEPVRGDTLKEILQAVHDLLYLLDFYAGHSWAIARIGLETIAAMKAEVPTQQQKRKK